MQTNWWLWQQLRRELPSPLADVADSFWPEARIPDTAQQAEVEIFFAPANDRNEVRLSYRHYRPTPVNDAAPP